MTPSTVLERLRPYLPLILSVLVAAFAGSGVAIVLVDDNPTTPDRTVTVLGAKPKPDELVLPAPGGAEIVVDQDQQVQPDEKALEDEKAAGVDIHEDAKDETPPGVTRDDVEAGEQRTAELAEDELVAPREPAGAQTVNCANRFVVNQSSLSARRVGVAMHFTVSPFGSINAIHGLFNTPAFGASSNYGFELISLECQRWVPEDRKAWAQGAFNSAYVSIEIVTNDLTRSQWLSTPAFKTGRLAALVREISLRVGSPMKLVDPVGCVALPGITDHDRLECGNSHWDVGKGFPWDVFISQVRQGVKTPALSSLERKLVAAARKPKGTGHSSAYWRRRLSAQIAWLERSQKVERRARRLAILRRVRRGTA